MNLILRLPILAAAFLFSVASGAEGMSGARKKLLFFSRSADFQHSAITREGGQPSVVEKMLTGLGGKNGLDFTFSKDGSLFTPAYLAGFDAFIFYTTGDLTTAGGDSNPPMTPAGKAALLQAIAGGKGFIGMHCATDTFHSSPPETTDEGNPPRYKGDGDNADPYIKMLGGEFIRHDAQQKAHLSVADLKFPGLSAVPADFTLEEEWYSQKNFPSDLHVLLVLETATMDGPAYQRPPYPAVWARMQGRGRVFYTCMGHRDDVLAHPVFQAVLLGGINWAVGRVDADVTPNLARVTPQANLLPLKPVPAK